MSPPFELAPGEVATWHAALDESLDRFAHLLSPEEIARRDRFAFPHLRTRFARGRGLLRATLARHVGQPPMTLAFGYGPQGKPELVGAPLRFNLSHSGDRWLLAVCPDREVGVDIEGSRAVLEMEAMVRRFFAPPERVQLFTLPPEERAAAFFRGWTRKEAVMKVSGEGMSLALDAFVVSLDAGDARLLAHDRDPSAVGRLRLVDLAAPPGFAAALAINGPGRARPAQDLPLALL